jgi:hypothetical protein
MTKLNEQQKQIALKAYMVGPARCQEEAIYAAVEAVLDQQAGALTDDQILSAMKVLNEDARCCLTRENWKDGIDITLPTHNARKFVAEIRALAQRSPEPAPVCPHCGPVCYGGAAHNARKEDGVIYAPAWTQADEDKARKVEFDAIDAPAPQSTERMHGAAEIERAMRDTPELGNPARNYKDVDRLIKRVLARLSAREQPSKEQPVI